MVCQARGEDPLITDRAVRQDQNHIRVAQGEVGQAVGDRGHSTARVDQDRNLGFFGERKDGIHLRAVERERLGARVQLDAARPVTDAAFALGDRAFGRVQATEGDQTTSAFLGPPQNTVVGKAVGRLALGVVQRENACPARVRVVQLREQRLQIERAAVLVEPKVGMGVEDFALRWPQVVGFGDKGSQSIGVD